MISRNSIKIKKIYAGSAKVRKMYLGSSLVYSAGGTVTYYVDTGTAYTEEVDSEATCLSPTTFTPTKSGYTFVGWREDATASSTVLTEKVMGDDSVYLYAVFKKTITLTYYNASSSASTTTGTQYYNNGNVVNPAFTLTAASKSGWTFSGWCTSSSATASIAYSSISNTTFSLDTTLYAKYYKTITLTYYSTSSTAATQTGTRYYNSGNYASPTFTISSPSLPGWTFLGWISGSTSATGTVSYSSVSSTTFTVDTTLYAKFSQTITLTCYSTSSTSATQTGTRYFNAYGNYSNPTFTISTPTLSGWTFLGWVSSTSATASIAYSSISSTAFSASATIYGKWSQTITLTYYNNSTTASTATGTRYFNAAGNYSNPTFTLTAASKSGWSFNGWCTGTAGNASIVYSSISGTAFSASVTLYARYSCTITLSYNGNSATSGSTSSQTGTRYYNSSGNYTNPTFTLASNGFTRTLYTFSKWAQGSTSGTQYSAGASVTLSASTTFYAIWTANACRLVVSAVQNGSYYIAQGNGWNWGIKFTFTLYTTSSGSTVYKSESVQCLDETISGTFAGILGYSSWIGVNGYDEDSNTGDQYLVAYISAKTTWYSNTGMSTTGLSSGGSIKYYTGSQESGTGVSGTTISSTYYVPASAIS